MRPIGRLSFALAALLVPLSLLAAGCGDKPTDVEEGEPLDIGGLVYNVAITRFLNPNNIEDKEYLVGQPPPPPGSDYLGVFLTITNEDEDTDLPSAHTYQIYDTTGTVYRPIPSKSPFALTIGANVPVDESLPLEDSTAATGPTESSMLLFLIPASAPDSRPFKMQVQSVLGDGLIQLDL